MSTSKRLSPETTCTGGLAKISRRTGAAVLAEPGDSAALAGLAQVKNLAAIGSFASTSRGRAIEPGTGVGNKTLPTERSPSRLPGSGDSSTGRSATAATGSQNLSKPGGGAAAQPSALPSQRSGSLLGAGQLGEMLGTGAKAGQQIPHQRGSSAGLAAQGQALQSKGDGNGSGVSAVGALRIGPGVQAANTKAAVSGTGRQTAATAAKLSGTGRQGGLDLLQTRSAVVVPTPTAPQDGAAASRPAKETDGAEPRRMRSTQREAAWQSQTSGAVAPGASASPAAGGLNIEKMELFLGKNETGSARLQAGKKEVGQGRGTEAATGFGAIGRDSPAVVKGAPSAGNASTSDTAAPLRDQVYQSIRTTLSQGQQQITVRLNPPELGTVSITLSERNGELTGLLEAALPQTRAEIQQALPDIIRSLQESGVNVRRLEATLADFSRQPSQQSFRESLSGEVWQQLGQHGFERPDGDRPFYDSSVMSAPPADGKDQRGATFFQQSRSGAPDGSLNILI